MIEISIEIENIEDIKGNGGKGEKMRYEKN